MLSDSYMEQVIKAKAGNDYYVKLGLPFLLAIIGSISVLFIGFIGIVIFAVGIYLFMNNAGDKQMEYEYILTNGNVEIAAIYNARKRKELTSFELEQVTMIVPQGSERIATEKFTKKRDYSSRTGKGQVISLVVEANGRRELVSIEPDERTMSYIKARARNKIYDL